MKKVVMGLAFVLFLVGIVSAVSTEITVYTEPYHDVTITIEEPTDQYALIKSFPGVYSGQKGIASITYEGLEPKIKVGVVVKKDGNTLEYGKFGPFEIGSEIEIDIPEGSKAAMETPEEEGNVTEETNETLTDEEDLEIDTTENTGDDEGVITGAVVSDDGNGISTIFYYILGILLLAGVIGFVVGKMVKTRKVRMGLAETSKKAPPAVPEPKDDSGNKEESNQEARIAEAERKIREAQQELTKLRNQEKIKSAEERLRKDQEELERLRKGD